MNRTMVVLAALAGGLAAAAVLVVARRRWHCEAFARHVDESVTIASEDSFPASDPPARTVTTGPMI